MKRKKEKDLSVQLSLSPGGPLHTLQVLLYNWRKAIESGSLLKQYGSGTAVGRRIWLSNSPECESYIELTQTLGDSNGVQLRVHVE